MATTAASVGRLLAPSGAHRRSRGEGVKSAWIDEVDVRIRVVIRARLLRLAEGIDARVGRRVYGAEYRSDAAVRKHLRKRVEAELRQRDAAWHGYTAGLTEAQIEAKIAADPAFVGAEQVANEAIHDLLRGRGEPRE